MFMYFVFCSHECPCDCAQTFTPWISSLVFITVISIRVLEVYNLFLNISGLVAAGSQLAHVSALQAIGNARAVWHRRVNCGQSSLKFVVLVDGTYMSHGDLLQLLKEPGGYFP